MSNIIDKSILLKRMLLFAFDLKVNQTSMNNLLLNYKLELPNESSTVKNVGTTVDISGM